MRIAEVLRVTDYDENAEQFVKVGEAIQFNSRCAIVPPESDY